MKVTALLPDDLINEVRNLTQAKNTTESLLVALKEWVAIQKVKQLNTKVGKAPLQFKEGFSVSSVRRINRL